MNIHPQLIRREGADEYVVLPIEEFRALKEIVHDDQDLQDLRAAKSQEADAASVPLPDVMQDLGIEP
ncbi:MULTISPECIES: type II toxin-antitoxin system Phd/YefM family antitoxin [unclassified Thiocapsa]|uniref:type II toxin-antitoxin system Phd/YefM family antitoxin n=1 Tax=unclassified Thiocapsa TaxID=2641286 RepID=UPI0035B2CA7A